MDVKSIMFLNGLTCVLLLSLSYVLILRFGIVGVGYAWIVSYLIGSFAVAILAREWIQ